jgi:uncharacterized repeat protein (TIGR01451 family)
VTGNNVTFHLGTVGAGSSATVQVFATINAGATQVTDQATISADNATTVNSLTNTVNVNPGAGNTSLSLSKSVCDVTSGAGCGGATSSIAASDGDTIQYRLMVTNTGTSATTGLSVSDTLGPNQTYVSCGAAGGACGPTGSTVNFTGLPALAAGASTTVTINATVNPSFSGVLTDTATASATNVPNSPISSNTTTVTVNTLPPPPVSSVLSVTKQVRDNTLGSNYGSTWTANPGDLLTYQIMVTNNGAATAGNVTVSDTLQGGQAYVSGSCVTVSCGTSGATITFYDGNLAPGATVTNTFSVYVQNWTTSYGHVIVNTASASANNAATANSNTTSVSVNGYTPPPVYYPPPPTQYPQYPIYTGANTICGLLTAYTPASSYGAGSLTLQGETFTLMTTLIPTGIALVPGNSYCLVFSTNSAGQLVTLTAYQNLPGANYVCGNISQFTNGYQPWPGYYPYAGYNPNASYNVWGSYPAGSNWPSGYYGYSGPMMIGSYPFYVPQNTVFPFNPQYGNTYCFLLNPTGQITGSLSVVPTLATPVDTSGQFVKRGRAWIG